MKDHKIYIPNDNLMLNKNYILLIINQPENKVVGVVFYILNKEDNSIDIEIKHTEFPDKSAFLQNFDVLCKLEMPQTPPRTGGKRKTKYNKSKKSSRNYNRRKYKNNKKTKTNK